MREFYLLVLNMMRNKCESQTPIAAFSTEEKAMAYDWP